MGNVPSNKVGDIDEQHFVEFHSELDEASKRLYDERYSEERSIDSLEYGGDSGGKPPVDRAHLSQSCSDLSSSPHGRKQKRGSRISKLRISTRIRSSKKKQNGVAKQITALHGQSSTDGGRTEDESSNVETSDQEGSIVERTTMSGRFKPAPRLIDDESSNFETSDPEGSITEQITIITKGGDSGRINMVSKPLLITQSYTLGSDGKTDEESSTAGESPPNPQRSDLARQWENTVRSADGGISTQHGIAQHFHEITSDSGVSSDEFGDWHVTRSGLGDQEWYKDWKKSVSTYENKYIPPSDGGSVSSFPGSSQVSPMGGTSTFQQTDHQQSFHERQVIKNLTDSAERYISQSVGDVSGIGKTGYSSQVLDLKIKETRGDTVVIKSKHGKGGKAPENGERASRTITMSDTRGTSQRSMAGEDRSKRRANDIINRSIQADKAGQERWEEFLRQRRQQLAMQPNEYRSTSIRQEVIPQRAQSYQVLTEQGGNQFVSEARMKEGASMREILGDNSLAVKHYSTRDSSEPARQLPLEHGNLHVDTSSSSELQRRSHSQVSPRIDREARAYIRTMADSVTVKHGDTNYVTSDTRGDNRDYPLSRQLELSSGSAADTIQRSGPDFHVRERYSESTSCQPVKLQKLTGPTRGQQGSGINESVESREWSQSMGNLATAGQPFSRHMRREYEYHRNTAGINADAKVDTEMRELYSVDGSGFQNGAQASSRSMGRSVSPYPARKALETQVVSTISKSGLEEKKIASPQSRCLDVRHQYISQSTSNLSTAGDFARSSASNVDVGKSPSQMPVVSTHHFARRSVSPSKLDSTRRRHFLLNTGGDANEEWKEKVDTETGSRVGHHTTLSSRRKRREFEYHRNRKGMSSSCVDVSRESRDHLNFTDSHRDTYSTSQVARSPAVLDMRVKDGMKHVDSPFGFGFGVTKEDVACTERATRETFDRLADKGSHIETKVERGEVVITAEGEPQRNHMATNDFLGKGADSRQHYHSLSELRIGGDKRDVRPYTPQPMQGSATSGGVQSGSSVYTSEFKGTLASPFSSRASRTFEYRKSTSGLDKEDTEMKETMLRIGSTSDGFNSKQASRTETVGLRQPSRPDIAASRDLFLSTETGLTSAPSQPSTSISSTVDQWHDAFQEFNFADSSETSLHARDFSKSTGHLQREEKEFHKVTEAYEKPLRQSRSFLQRQHEEGLRRVVEEQPEATHRPSSSQRHVTYSDDAQNRSKSMDTVRTQDSRYYDSCSTAPYSTSRTKRIFEYTRNTTAVEPEAEVSTKTLEIFDRYGNRVIKNQSAQGSTHSLYVLPEKHETSSDALNHQTYQDHITSHGDRGHRGVYDDQGASMRQTQIMDHSGRNDARDVTTESRVTGGADSGSVISLNYEEKQKLRRPLQCRTFQSQSAILKNPPNQKLGFQP